MSATVMAAQTTHYYPWTVAMNATTSIINIEEIRPALAQLADQFPLAMASLLIPTLLLYLSIYARVIGHYAAYKILTFSSIAAYFACPYITPIYCGPVRCLQNFAIAIGTMKMLDIYARRHALPVYTSNPRPRPWLFALVVLTELRYESFTPNHIRVARNAENFSEPMQLAVHTGVFMALQSLPQIFPTVLAFEVLLAIYILWTSMHFVLRYKSSPALFGPLYLADSLTGFWSETWHNAFASPCQSIAYNPVRVTLPKYGVPVSIARALGVIAAFGLMAVFHVYALAPILPRRSLIRIGLFFLLNGIGTVVEGLLWGKRKHWAKVVLAWTFETLLATWTAQAAHIPNGLSKIPWRDMCGPPSEW